MSERDTALIREEVNHADGATADTSRANHRAIDVTCALHKGLFEALRTWRGR